MIGKKVSSQNGDIYYWISEEKKDKCIMFSHGLTADHTLFDKQIEFWSKGYTVIVWDMPLHGLSKEYKNFSYTNAANEMKRILDKENIKHTVMVGQSAGGYIVQEFIRMYKDMCDAFISIDSSPLGLKYYKKSDLFFICNFAKFIKLYPYNSYCKLSAKSVARTEEAQESFLNTLKRLDKKSLLKAVDLVYKDFKNYPEVEIECPVLLVVGEYDNFGKVREYNKLWEKDKGYLSITIEGASHNSNYDNYKEFNNKVYQFLSRLK